ncbi:MAG TPA: flavodoxin family protein [Chloroflexia bacterium]|nr:flavodoxin family protein [Chloroflexia bacterium]
MKALVLYDSTYGNTKTIAETVAKVIEAELVSMADFKLDMLAGVDLFVVGSPIHGWHPSEATTAFLTQLEKSELNGKYVASFDTGYSSWLSGNAASRIMKALTKAGGRQIVPTHKFIVVHAEEPLGPMEIERAKLWASEIKAQYEAFTYPAKTAVS